MELSTYEARRSELDAQMQKLNEMESEKKMELSIKYQKDCKRIQAQIGTLKRQQKDLLKNYQNDKAWWHRKFKDEKREVSEKMHMLRFEYLTANGVDCRETRRREDMYHTPAVVLEQERETVICGRKEV